MLTYILAISANDDPEAELERMRSFFIARKGRFRAFNFQWKKQDENGRPLGGNDQWYIVRFDTDKLDFKIDQLGYKTFTVPIVQVMSGE